MDKTVSNPSCNTFRCRASVAKTNSYGFQAPRSFVHLMVAESEHVPQDSWSSKNPQGTKLELRDVLSQRAEAVCFAFFDPIGTSTGPIGAVVGGQAQRT